MSWHRHAAHTGDPAQLLFDNCGQCLDMSANPAAAIGAMEAGQFEDAWNRAIAWTRGLLHDEPSGAEIPVLEVFVTLSGKFAQRGFEWGTVPAGERQAVAS